MKKAIAILLALLMVLSLAACGGGGTTTPTPEPVPTIDPNIIELTTDNYKKYLKTSCLISGMFPHGKTSVELEYRKDLGGGESTYYIYSGIPEIDVFVDGASPNFNYNDIVTTFRINGTYKDIEGLDGSLGDTVDFSVDITIELDVGGHGFAKTSYELPSGHYTHPDLIDFDFEIIEISGTVSKS